MIKHDITNCFTGETQFTAYIDCEEVSSDGWKKRLAVLWAIKNGSNLSRTDLRETHLYGIDLSEADLRGTDLRGTNLRGTNLRGTDLSGADLRGTDLRGTNLRGTDLYGANLYEAKGIVSFGPVGKTGRIGYAVNRGSHAMVRLGCFWGTEKEALKAIKEKYGPKSSYAKLVEAACAVVMKGGE